MKLLKKDINAKVRECLGWCKSKHVHVEVGLRLDKETGKQTHDSLRWDDETSDLEDLAEVNRVDVRDGQVLDLYVYEWSQFERNWQLECNLDLVVKGLEIEVREQNPDSTFGE